jgi:hypothetical protein
MVALAIMKYLNTEHKVLTVEEISKNEKKREAQKILSLIGQVAGAAFLLFPKYTKVDFLVDYLEEEKIVSEEFMKTFKSYPSS